MSDAPSNLLYYGDNLDNLRRYVNDESVDLVYLERAVQFQRRLQRAVRREERGEGPGPDQGVRGHLGMGPGSRAGVRRSPPLRPRQRRQGAQSHARLPRRQRPDARDCGAPT